MRADTGKANLALLHHVRCAIAPACLGSPQATSDTDVEGVQAMNKNNLIISPLNTVMRRFEDQTSYLKDEIDGIYMKVQPNVDSIETSNVVTAILAATTIPMATASPWFGPW